MPRMLRQQWSRRFAPGLQAGAGSSGIGKCANFHLRYRMRSLRTGARAGIDDGDSHSRRSTGEAAPTKVQAYDDSEEGSTRSAVTTKRIGAGPM